MRSAKISASVPLARPEIAGAINLRGHIVTAINLRARLGAPAREAGEKIVDASATNGLGTYLVSPAILKLTVPANALVGTYASTATIAAAILSLMPFSLL